MNVLCPFEFAYIMAVSVLPGTVPARKMPKGAEKDPSALCYTAGPQMSKEMLTARPLLRHVLSSETRDSSNPAIRADIESDSHCREVAYPRNRFAHINEPVARATLQESFMLHFIHPTMFDKEIELVLVPKSNETRQIRIAKLQLDGNQIREKVQRPTGLAVGEYGALANGNNLKYQLLRLNIDRYVLDFLFRMVDADGISKLVASTPIIIT